jgi:hypothetical protein
VAIHGVEGGKSELVTAPSKLGQELWGPPQSPTGVWCDHQAFLKIDVCLEMIDWLLGSEAGVEHARAARYHCQMKSGEAISTLHSLPRYRSEAESDGTEFAGRMILLERWQSLIATS